MKQWQIFLMLGFFLLVLSSFDSAEAAASPVAISSDKSSADVLVDDYVEFTLTLSNSDTKYRKQDVYLVHNWPSGVAWSTEFVDTDYNVVEGNLVSIVKDGSTTIKLAIFCDGACSAGDTNTVQIYAKTDPKFYQSDENATDSCGSSDCKNDTTPASESSNVTNTISLALTARMAYDSMVGCDTVASTGDNKVYHNTTLSWAYTLTNVGWNTDSYQFTGHITSADSQDVSYWTVNPGMANGKELAGQSDTSSTAVHAADGVITIVSANNATSGVYNIELTVTSTGGGADAGCNFDVVVPETEEETTGDPANETAEEETKEPGGTGEACTGCSAECCEFCADTDGECPYDCVYNEDQSDNPSSCLAPDAGEDVEIIEEVPSVSLMSAMAVLGSIVIFRRKWV